MCMCVCVCANVCETASSSNVWAARCLLLTAVRICFVCVYVCVCVCANVCGTASSSNVWAARCLLLTAVCICLVCVCMCVQTCAGLPAPQMCGQRGVCFDSGAHLFCVCVCVCICVCVSRAHLCTQICRIRPSVSYPIYVLTATDHAC